MGANSSLFFPVLICVLLVLFPGSLGQLPFGLGQQTGRRLWGSQTDKCRLESLQAVEPSRRVQAEAGVTEYWDQNDAQFQCAGVAAFRTTIQPKGLHLPYFSNSPRLIYVLQGRGVSGLVIPGCPETFQSFQRSQEEEERGPQQKLREQHQRVHYFRDGDVIAEPAGFATWFYNDGDMPLVTVTVVDTSNQANQLGQSLRRFQLAGQQQQRPESIATPGEEIVAGNIFNGFDAEMLAQAFGVSRETAVKLQGRDDRRGNIVRVERGLQLPRPTERRSYQQEEEQQEEEKRCRRSDNGLEEALCTIKNTQNIGDAWRADVHNPRAGRVTFLNSQKLPILRSLQMSAERGVLQRNAQFVPHWNINAHSILYVIKGRGRVQISGHQTTSKFDHEVHQGQIVVIPQNFVVAARALSENFEWVSFKTNDNAMVSPLAGKASVFRALPEAVIQSSYRVNREEASMIKYNRAEEFLVLQPRAQEMKAST